MQYLYQIYDKKTKTRVDTTTRMEDFENNYCDFENYYVVVTDMLAEISIPLHCEDINDWLMWREKLERDAAWKPSKVMGKDPLDTPKKEEVFELPQKGHSYFVEDDGFHLTQKDLESMYIKDPIDPDHYQNFIEDLQWIEAEFRKPQFRNNPDAVKGALIFQINKYLGRCGRKDEELQEVSKALWYCKFLVAYLKVGCQPIRVEEVEHILSGKLKLSKDFPSTLVYGED
jgi:hypothetical protein